jgi:hypothetical protein
VHTVDYLEEKRLSEAIAWRIGVRSCITTSLSNIVLSESATVRKVPKCPVLCHIPWEWPIIKHRFAGLGEALRVP